MAAVVFALVLAGLLFWLEQESCVHSLDDLQGLLETEDFLAEADQPVNLRLTVRNSGPHWKSFAALRLPVQHRPPDQRLRRAGAHCAVHGLAASAAGGFVQSRGPRRAAGPLCIGAATADRRRPAGPEDAIPHRAGLP